MTGGRSFLGKPIEPSCENIIVGRVVVDVVADENGNVSSVTIGKGTNIPDVSIRNAVLSAAKRTKFTTGSGIATGKITYNFRFANSNK